MKIKISGHGEDFSPLPMIKNQHMFKISLSGSEAFCSCKFLLYEDSIKLMVI